MAAAGSAHSAAVGEEGTLFLWGSGEHGRLGTGDTASRRNPTRIAGLSAPVRQVAAGCWHTGVVTDAGDLHMCGDGHEGQLGLGDGVGRTSLTLLDRVLFDDDAVLMVACGDEHTAVLTEGGGVFTFGKGSFGRLGHGTEDSQLAPRRVLAAGFSYERVVMLAAGEAHTVGLSEKGHVFTWGHGEDGQLGLDDPENQLVPQQVKPGQFGGETVVFVAAGGFHTVGVTGGGRLFLWGRGGNGQLAHGAAGNRRVPTLVRAETFGGSAVVMAACGGFHTLVLTQDGALWACGGGLYGQLGLSDELGRSVFERVGTSQFGAARVTAVSAGFRHSAAVTEDGALWTWGHAADGRLGHGNVSRRRVPALVAAAEFSGERIGRCRALPAEHALAFAMGTHWRLGAAAGAHCSGLKEELVVMIVLLSSAWPTGSAGVNDGVVRLLGGGVQAGQVIRGWPKMAERKLETEDGQQPLVLKS